MVNDNTLGKLPLKIIVPLTDWKDRYEIAAWMVKVEPDRINKLTKDISRRLFSNSLRFGTAMHQENW